MMVPILLLTVALTLILAASDVPSSTSSYLSTSDRTRMKKILEPGFKLEDVQATYHAVIGYKLAGDTIPKTAEICKYLLSSVGDGNNITPEIAFYITTTWKTIRICKPLPTPIIKTLTTVIEKDTASIPELYYAVNSLTSLSQKLPEVTVQKLVKTLQVALKKDDSLLNLGYVFHIASNLGRAGEFAFKRIEDAVIQADEVDGRFLQFEGGLSITSLLVNGIFELSASLKMKPLITAQQIVKLSNYFLSRRSVQTPKGVISLLSALVTLANNQFDKPICITLADSGITFEQQPLVNLKVCDILGRPLPKTPSVIANSATRIGDDVVIASKKNFQLSDSDKTLFTLNLMEIKPDRGFYKISVSAGSVSNIVTVKVLSKVTVDYLEVGTGDADQTTQPKLTRVEYSKQLGKIIEADSQQKLVMRFLLKDSISNKAMRVHQAFVRLFSTSEDTERKRGQEIIFVAEPDASHVYKFDMPVGSAAGNFGYDSGDYNLELIIGDALLLNSFQWVVAKVTLKFPDLVSAETSVAREKSAPYKQKPNIYTPKLEIKHMFREPEKRPPPFVSNLFTGLCLAPLLLLFILWTMLGVNISNFPLSLNAIIFHLGLGGIFVLFGIFWLKLNMFVTLRYLLGISVVTFLAGNKMLSHIASYKRR